MLNEVTRASLVLALSPQGELTVVKNSHGPRLPRDGLRALAQQLHPEDREIL